MKDLKPFALVLSFSVIVGCSGGHGSASAPVAVPSRATLTQQEQCSRDGERRAESLIAKPSVITSHFDPSSNRCAVLLDFSFVDATSGYTDKALYDANERTHLAQLRLSDGSTHPSSCWVADQTGFHKGCDSVNAFDDLLKKYYGVQE